MNYLLDNNVIIDILSKARSEIYIDSIKVFKHLKEKNFNLFISSSSLDNIEFTLFKEIKKRFNYSNKDTLSFTHIAIKKFLEQVEIAKTPSYIEIDYDDIEDSQIIASAKALDAKVITRDEGMLKKYPNQTLHPSTFTLSPHSIDFANLKKQHFLYYQEIEKEIDNVLNKTNFIMGEPVKTLEKNLEKFTGAKHAITCSSGTDALLLAMMALDIKPDDEIITTPFTFIATAETIALLGAKPVFVDIDERTYNIDATKIEEKITDKTKAIMPVSLYGQPPNLDAIQAIADKYKLKVIIDGAQSFGSTYKGKTDSNLGDISTTSFFPAKPLGCYGDGGAVFTNDDELAQKMKSLRVHGQSKRYHHKYIGMGGRMDTIQCAIVNVKLKYYPQDLALRQEVASKYIKALGSKVLTLPYIAKETTSAFAQYSIRVKNRDKLQAKLKDAKIPTAVHYPRPLHLQECLGYLGYKEGDFLISEIVSKEIMSIPMNPYVSDEEIKYISKHL